MIGRGNEDQGERWEGEDAGGGEETPMRLGLEEACDVGRRSEPIMRNKQANLRSISPHLHFCLQACIGFSLHLSLDSSPSPPPGAIVECLALLLCRGTAFHAMQAHGMFDDQLMQLQRDVSTLPLFPEDLRSEDFHWGVCSFCSEPQAIAQTSAYTWGCTYVHLCARVIFLSCCVPSLTSRSLSLAPCLFLMQTSSSCASAAVRPSRCRARGPTSPTSSPRYLHTSVYPSPCGIRFCAATQT